MDMDGSNDATETLGYFALLPNEMLQRVFLWLQTAADACHLSTTCRAFHEMASDQLLWRALYITFGATDPDAVPEAWDKDWRWLCRARTTPANDVDSIETVCGTKAYYGGRCVYHGQLLDGLPDGYGVMVVMANDIKEEQCRSGLRVFAAFPSAPTRGCRVEGQWVGGTFVDGRCAFADKEHAFIGIFRHDMVAAAKSYYDGVWVYENGDRYTGRSKRDTPHGRGVYEHADGRRYEGDYFYGVREGHCVASYVNGARYVGQWKNDMRHGQGALTTKTGTRHEGQWVCGKLHGHGIEIDVRGFRFEGSYIDGERAGYGVQIWDSGKRYEGDWVGDGLHGQGLSIDEDGNKYEGRWKDDLKEGHGVEHYANGDQYEGQWSHGMKDGRGIYRSTEYIHEGEWLQDKRHGQGICWFPDGTHIEGLWRDDAFVGDHGFTTIAAAATATSTSHTETQTRKRARGT